MSATSAKRGSAARFLAVTASLTMIVTGLVGVAFAAPASADSPIIWICHADTDNAGNIILGGGNTGLGYNLQPISETGYYSGHKPADTTAANYHPFDFIAKKVGPGEGAYSCDTSAPYDECPLIDGNQPVGTDCTPPGQCPDASVCTPSGSVAGGSGTFCVGTSTTTLAWPGATYGLEGQYPTKAAAEKAVSDGQKAATAGAIEGVCTTGGGGGGESVTYSAPGGSGMYCSATNGTVTVTWAGVSGQASQTQANEGAAFTMNTALQASGVAFGTNPGACAVVNAAVVVAAPLPATVPVPVKKPVAVSAAKPAEVAGGVVSTSIPQAATIPAAVPAGDGSQAPGLPMWALALMVIGTLGAAVAGKQMLDARN